MQIITNKSQKELKEHGSFQFPVLVSRECLSGCEKQGFSLALASGGGTDPCYRWGDRIPCKRKYLYFKRETGVVWKCKQPSFWWNGGVDSDCHYISVTRSKT